MVEKSLKKENNIVGIKFAPWDVPISRRLQTLSVLIWFFPMFVLPSFGIFFLSYIFFYTNYRFISILYMIWYFYDKDTPIRGGRRIDFICNLRVWKSLSDYFPIRLVKTSELNPSKNYLMAYHPHGIISLGDIVNFGTEGTNVTKVFPGIKMSWLTLNANFNIPFYREYVLALGGCSVSKESMCHILNDKNGGRAVIVVTGGAREALYAKPNVQAVYLKNRKGFIKVALQTGADLVPIYAFGETDVFEQVPNPEGSILLRFQKWYLKLTGVAPVLPFGRGIFIYSFGFLPFRRPITTVVGRPIPVEKNPNPTNEEIDKLHEKYIQELTKLYYENREKYGKSNEELEILNEEKFN